MVLCPCKDPSRESLIIILGSFTRGYDELASYYYAHAPPQEKGSFRILSREIVKINVILGVVKDDKNS